MKLTKVQDVVTLEIEESGAYEVYDEAETLLVKGEGDMTWKDTSIHPVVKVVKDGNTTYIGQRDLPETNITNFRDLGGYFTEDGKQVRYHTFYRCAPVIANDEEAKQVLTSLSLQTIMDFRSITEAEKAPDTKLANCEIFQIGAIRMKGNDFGGNLDFKALMENVDIATLKQYMENIYQTLPFDNTAYSVMFQRMLEHKVPLAFHCSAGKDRTGVAAYLILKTLGVCDEIILQDYLLSNVYRHEENERVRKLAGPMGDMAMSLMQVEEGYLKTTMNAIAQRYSSFEAYLLKEYGIDEETIQRLRAMYLYS